MFRMLSTYTNFFTSAASVSVSLGWTLGSKLLTGSSSPMRVALSFIFRKGIRVSVDTWINKQRRKRMRQLRSGIQVKFSKRFRLGSPRNKRRLITPASVGGEHDIIAVDAALKYEVNAKMRLERARRNFEDAATELKEAERGVADAKKYTKSVKSYCEKCQRNPSHASDYVFVDPLPKAEVTKKVVVVKEELDDVN